MKEKTKLKLIELLGTVTAVVAIGLLITGLVLNCCGY